MCGQERIGSGAGLPLLYKAMEEHVGHVGVQERACETLGNLASNAANQVRGRWVRNRWGHEYEGSG